jgi:hypothetical protein
MLNLSTAIPSATYTEPVKKVIYLIKFDYKPISNVNYFIWNIVQLSLKFLILKRPKMKKFYDLVMLPGRAL